LGLVEALSAEAEPRPTEGGGKHPPEAKSFGKSSAEGVKRREMPPPPVTNCHESSRAVAGQGRLQRTQVSSGPASGYLAPWTMLDVLV